MVEKKRLPAIKISPKEITNGKYVSKKGFTPNCVITPKGRKISRVRIMGTVVKKFINDKKTFASITLDDGKGTIRGKIFNAVSMLKDVNEGDIVDIVGKVREYQDEIYVNLETLHKIKTPNYEILRRLELNKEDKNWENVRKKIMDMEKQVADLEELKNLMKNRFNVSGDVVENILQSENKTEEKKEEGSEAKEEILKVIKQEDGCHYEELIKQTGYAEEVVSQAINKLLTDGECFEPKPGVIKCL